MLSQCLWLARHPHAALLHVLHGIGVGSGGGGGDRLQEDESCAGMDGIRVEYHVVGQDHQHYKDHKFVHRLDALGGLQT